MGSNLFGRMIAIVPVGAMLVVAPDFFAVDATAGARQPRCMGTVATIVGTSRSEEIVGTPTSDVIVGLGGDDRILGRGGSDLICAGDGFDFVRGGRGRDELAGGAGDDALDGDAGGDRLRGQRGIDALFGGGGDDRLRGGPNVGLGTEGLIGGPGDDLLVGGPGLDSAQFFDATSGVQADLTSGVATGRGSDTLVEVEGLVGSNFDDVLVGDDGTNGVFGQAGDDELYGLGSGTLGSRAFDVLAGDDGADRIDGGDGFDLATYGRIPVAVSVDLASGTASGQGEDVLLAVEGAIGTVLDDVLSGDGSANAFAAGPGNDTIDGAAGIDTAIFADVHGPVTVDLVAGTATGAGSDTLTSLEDVWGTGGDDVLAGDDVANVLHGSGGDDRISEAAGDDLLVGGRGPDTLDGGDGTDACLSGAVTVNCEADAANARGVTGGDGSLARGERSTAPWWIDPEGSLRPDPGITFDGVRTAVKGGL